ncbi:MAG TPA: hypothetical protein VLX90_14570 [Steroidobacteraceae bacterium]|nr:hypothetical protein [Steroidobacteraceae bacterium]
MTAPAFCLHLEPDYCCGGGHCGPLPGYTFVCPSCGKPSSCRTGEPLREGQALICFLCRRVMRMVGARGEFDLLFVFDDGGHAQPATSAGRE